MARAMRGEVELRQAACFPPLAINIERQRTAEPHCVSIHQHVERMRAQKGILSVSLVLGFPYADVPEMGSAVIVVCDGRSTEPAPHAEELARCLWQHRQHLVGELIGVEKALDSVQNDRGPVLLLDMGDNVGGGAPGDGTSLARALHARRVRSALVTLCDPEAVVACTGAGRGTRTSLRMGARSAGSATPPLESEVEVLACFEGRFRETQVRHGGWADFDMGPPAIVRTDSQLTIMLTSKRLFPVSVGQWTQFGIEPRDYRVIVAKGVQPVAGYESICSRTVRVNTAGVTCADMEALEYAHRRRPLFPFEREFDWKP
jgi:microcystin degradation protein MlrC